MSIIQSMQKARERVGRIVSDLVKRAVSKNDQDEISSNPYTHMNIHAYLSIAQKLENKDSIYSIRHFT